MPPRRRPITYQENHDGCSVTPEEFVFLKAVERYQREYHRRYPSFREILYVLHSLGYRKVAPAEAADLEAIAPLRAPTRPEETPP